MASSSRSETCGICNDALEIPNPDDASYPPIPDDVILRCSHHFHWTCLMDHATSTPSPLPNCPLCNQNVLSPNGEFIVSIRNEGGLIPDFNMGEEIAREAFLEENPEARRTEIFLGLMAQGDLEEAEIFLKGEDGDGEEGPLSADVTEGGNNALHVAALNDDVDGVMLLLRYGADKGLRTVDGFTALDLARSQDAHRVVTLLEQQ